jgi:hypothetical protein
MVWDFGEEHEELFGKVYEFVKNRITVWLVW